MGATVSPDRVLHELHDLWVSLGKQGEGDPGAGVLRACSMTLIVLGEEAEDAQALGETLAALMPEHPARTILVRMRGAGERVIEDRVYAQCWKPFGQRRQICCEHIEITASDSALPELPPVLLPLVAPDLPVILWCRSPRLIELDGFREIARMSRKIIVDSAAFADTRDAIRRIAAAAERGMLLGDLAWTRLTRWREMVSQVFENRKYLAALPAVRSARVRYGEGNQALAWYMAAWIANALARAGVNVRPEIAAAGGAALEVVLEGEGIRVELARENDRLVVTVNGLAAHTNLSHPDDCLLMREELGITSRDAVFEETLASAAALAYATGK
jgi:glucose-6-phosphate dehydrogenase assembly protein OpcA